MSSLGKNFSRFKSLTHFIGIHMTRCGRAQFILRAGLAARKLPYHFHLCRALPHAAFMVVQYFRQPLPLM